MRLYHGVKSSPGGSRLLREKGGSLELLVSLTHHTAKETSHLINQDLTPGNGHESMQTTHGYLEADLATKEQVLEKVTPAGQVVKRFKADDTLLRFLATLG